MRKSNLFILFSWMLLALSCSSDDDPVDNNEVAAGELKDISVMIPAFVYEQPSSRLDVNLVDNRFVVNWENEDTLGIIPEEGIQAPFPIKTGSGSDSPTAHFTGGGWALKASAKYAAYFPYVANSFLDRTKIPVRYTGQSQSQNGDYDHLSDYIYMVSDASYPNKDGYINFQMKHLGCYAIIEVNVPEPTKFSSLRLITEEPLLVKEARVDLTMQEITLLPGVNTDTLFFDIEGVETVQPNEKAELSFMFAPADLAGKSVKGILCDETGYEEEVAFTGKNMLAGHAYKYGNLNYVTYPAQPKPNWTYSYDEQVYEIGMSAVVTVPRSIRKYMGEEDELAAFVNGEVRGVGKYINGAFYLMVYGNIGEKGKVCFKYYSAKKQYLYEANDVVYFDSNTIFGLTDEPEVLPLVLVK